MLLAGLVLCGCNKISIREAESEYSVGVLLKAHDSPYWQDMKTGLEEGAYDYGVTLNVLYPSGEIQTEQQEKLADDMLDSDIDVFIIAPNDCYNTNWMKQKADKNGIIMMNIDDRSVDVDVPFIGSNHEQIGRDAADYFKETLEKGSSIYMFLGTEATMSSQDRLYGFQTNSEDYLNILDTVYMELSEEEAYWAMMNEEEEPDGVFCQHVVTAQGVVAALEEKGWHSKVVTVDTPSDAAQVIRAGKIDAIIQQDGYEIGYKAIEVAVKTLQSGELPHDTIFDCDIITNDNIKDIENTDDGTENREE